MKQLLCLVAIALLPFFSIAQIHLDKKNSINFAVGLAAGNRILTGFDSVSQVRANYFSSHSKMLLNYQFGFDYQRILTKTISMKVGLRFARWGHTEDHNQDVITKYDLRGIYYLEVPISVQYTWLNNKRLKPFVEVGVAAMLGVAGETNVSLISTGAFNPLAVSAQVGVGLSYQISNKISLYGQVMGRIQLSPASRIRYSTVVNTSFPNTYIDHDIVYHFYNIGAELGVRAHF